MSTRPPRHRRRQRGRGLGRLPGQRGDRHLPDHAVLDDGRAVRRVVEQGQDQPLGRRPRDGRDAVGRRRRGRGPRRAPGGRPGDDLHGLPGPAPDDPQHVQDRGRADAVHHARGGAHAGHPRPVDLRRPLGRHGLPPDRLRDARARTRCRRPTTSRPSPTPRRSSRACPSCTSSTASAPRTRWRRSRS